MLRYKSTIALNLSVFLMMSGVGMIVALLPQKIMDLSGSMAKVGYLASSFAVSYILLQIPIGRWSDRLGFKPFLASGYIICALTGVVYYLSATTGPIFIGRFLQGAGEAPVWALAPALLSIQHPRAKGKMMGLYNASMHLGLTAGPLAGVLAARIWTGNEPFLLYASVCLFGGTLIQFFVENPKPGRIVREERIDYTDIRRLLAAPRIRLILIGILGYGAGYGIFITVIPAYLIQVKGFDQVSAGYFFALFYLAISLSQVVAGPLSDKLGRKVFMTCGLIVGAIGVFLFPGLDSLWIIGILAAASFGLGAFFVSSMAYVNERVPNEVKGTISGAYFLFFGGGYFAGPLIIGGFGDRFGYKAGFFLLALFFLIEASALAAVPRRGSDRPSG